MKDILQLRIVLLKPPAGIDFALQSGSGNNYDRVQKQVSGTADMVFELGIKLKQDTSGQFDFAGPFVQGGKGERFIYIGIGVCAGNIQSVWSRRLKVPLRDIAPGAIEKVIADDQLVLETRVPGTHRDGGPNCATVKPFDGWDVGKR